MVSVRTTRQNRVQSMTTMAAITECRPAPSTATSRMESSTGGNAIQISTSREITASTIWPKKPAIRPSSEPIRQAGPAATNATVSDTRVPKITRESTSRPSPSVPSRNPGSASAKPAGGNRRHQQILRQRILRRDQRRGDRDNDQKKNETAGKDNFRIAQPAVAQATADADRRPVPASKSLLVTSVPRRPDRLRRAAVVD